MNSSDSQTEKEDKPTAAHSAAIQRKQRLLNLATCFLLLIVIAFAFQKTVFQGKQISRVYQLGQRDSLYGKYFTPIREGYDASVYQYFVPSHYFLVKSLRQGVIPLWNPLVGCGEPFMADIETATFSPLRAALLWMEPLRSWNLLIVLNLMNFAIGTFVLSLSVGLRRFAGIFAALCCAFSPFLIFQSELIGSSSSWIPLVIASFVQVAKSGSIPGKITAGLACAIMIVSGHPEPSFFGIVTASLTYLLIKIVEAKRSATAWAKSLAFALLDILQIGIFAFAFSAPLLIPFAEYLKNSDCYKLGLSAHRDGVPLNSLLVNWIHPAYGKASPFSGILALPLALTGIFLGVRKNAFHAALGIGTLILLALMSQLGPIDYLMNLPAFSWFVPKYCLPSLIIFISLLMGFGVQNIADNIQKQWKTVCISLLSFSILCIAGMLAIKAFPALLNCVRQDEAFEQMIVNGKQWTKDIIIITSFCVLAFAARILKGFSPSALVACAAICTALSMGSICKSAAPVTSGFNYDLVDPIPFLQKSDARILTMGRHTFCPSSNFVYGINNLVPVNVYHPKGFLQYLHDCGITHEGVNQFFDNSLSPDINEAAIKYIVTQQPILSTTSQLPSPSPLQSATPIAWTGQTELLLEGASFQLEEANKELFGTLRFKTSAARAKQVGVQVVLQDKNGTAIWFSDPERLLYLFAKNEAEKIDSFDTTMKIPLPDFKEDLQIALQIFDWDKNEFVPLMGTAAGSQATLQKLAELKHSQLTSTIVRSIPKTAASQNPFKLVFEGANKVRVYENLSAQPNCHLAQMQPNSSAKTAQLPEADGKVTSFRRLDANNVEINAQVFKPCILVISQLYQPQWKATLRTMDAAQQKQGLSPAETSKVDGYFQAVKIPSAGNYSIQLKYEPESFTIGIAIFFLGVASSAALLVRSRKKS